MFTCYRQRQTRKLFGVTSFKNKIHLYIKLCTNLHCKENCNKGESHNKEQHHEDTYNVFHRFIHYAVNLKIHKTSK